MSIRQLGMTLVAASAAAMILHGFYAAWRGRRGQRRLGRRGLNRHSPPPEIADDELPGGGARTVRRREGSAAAWQLQKARRQAAALGFKNGTAEGRSIPILMDAVELEGGGEGEEGRGARGARGGRGGPKKTVAPPPFAGLRAGADEILVMNVTAKEGRRFQGEELLEVLMTAGLKLGEMDIFHHRLEGGSLSADGSRFAEGSLFGDGPVVFSVADILNPGTFDINAIEDFSTVGLSLFLVIPSPKNNQQAFNDMLRTAEHIKTALDGELRDDHRNLMTPQTIEHYRQRIRDFELHKMQKAR